MTDLKQLQKSNIAAELRNYVNNGGHIFGICGGMQMLGKRLNDPDALEGKDINNSSQGGLDLLPLNTDYGCIKALQQRCSNALWPRGGIQIEGFELHRGSSSSICTEAEPIFPIASDPDLGYWLPYGSFGGVVAGTYLHGIFENGIWRRCWLNQLRKRKGLALLSEQQAHHRKQRDLLLDRLADAFEAHVNIEPLLRP